jgi:methyl-accepting chemotaxis protein
MVRAYRSTSFADVAAERRFWCKCFDVMRLRPAKYFCDFCDRVWGRSTRGAEKRRFRLGDTAIHGSSQRISKIINVIEGIAFQTNILALNAAVEAARAGDAGLGFAVVAEEVRNLAQRCSDAAKETTALIEESVNAAAGGKSGVNEVLTAVEKNQRITGEVTTRAAEVSASTAEQARGLQQIARAVVQMQELTQRTAASSEESAASSEELNAHATELKQLVTELQSVTGL